MCQTNGVIFKELLVLEFVTVQKFVRGEAKKVKWDAEVSSSKTRTSTHKDSLNSQGERSLESTRKQGNKNSEFYWLIIVQKNIYRSRNLFKGFVKLDRKENIF